MKAYEKMIPLRGGSRRITIPEFSNDKIGQPSFWGLCETCMSNQCLTFYNSEKTIFNILVFIYSIKQIRMLMKYQPVDALLFFNSYK